MKNIGRNKKTEYHGPVFDFLNSRRDARRRESRILRYLALNGKSTAEEITEAFGIKLSSSNMIMQRLRAMEKKDFVKIIEKERKSRGPGDKYYWGLTTKCLADILVHPLMIDQVKHVINIITDPRIGFKLGLQAEDLNLLIRWQKGEFSHEELTLKEITLQVRALYPIIHHIIKSPKWLHNLFNALMAVQESHVELPAFFKVRQN